MDKIATRVLKTTVTISPKVNFLPALSFHTSSPSNFLEYNAATKNVKKIKNNVPPKLKPNRNAFCSSNLCTKSIILLNLFISNSKLEKDATVLILYNISSAIPPAFSYDFLEPIIGFFKDTTRKTTHIKIRGLIESITKVNSHDL